MFIYIFIYVYREREKRKDERKTDGVQKRACAPSGIECAEVPPTEDSH